MSTYDKVRVRMALPVSSNLACHRCSHWLYILAFKMTLVLMIERSLSARGRQRNAASRRLPACLLIGASLASTFICPEPLRQKQSHFPFDPVVLDSMSIGACKVSMMRGCRRPCGLCAHLAAGAT